MYEAGATRGVTFTRAGACFIFCNIHPEMSAVVVVVDSAYYAVSNRNGEVRIDDVPPGRYLLSVWHERAKPERPAEFPREVTITPEGASLGAIHLVQSGLLIAPHKNKYGRDYDPQIPANAVYK